MEYPPRFIVATSLINVPSIFLLMNNTQRCRDRDRALLYILSSPTLSLGTE